MIELNKGKKIYLVISSFVCILFLLEYFYRTKYGVGIIGNTEALSSVDDFIFVTFFILFTSIFHYVFFILPYCKNKYIENATAMSVKIYLYKLLFSFVLHVFITDYFIGIEFFLIFILMFIPKKGKNSK